MRKIKVRVWWNCPASTTFEVNIPDGVTMDETDAIVMNEAPLPDTFPVMWDFVE